MPQGEPNTMIAILPIVLLILGAGATYFVIRRKLYWQAILSLVFLGAVGTAIWGVVYLQDSHRTDDWQGIALLGFGLTLLLICALCVRKFYFSNERSRS